MSRPFTTALQGYPSHRCRECTLVRCHEAGQICDECLTRVPLAAPASVYTFVPGMTFFDPDLQEFNSVLQVQVASGFLTIDSAQRELDAFVTDLARHRAERASKSL